MHRLPNLFSLPARFLAVSLALLLIQSAPNPAWSADAIAQSSSATKAANCDGVDCRVNFSFSGATQSWTAPPGSGNFRIEIAGGSGGGERGGSGALIRATLKIKSGQVLELRLGGAGKRGDGVAGGFNGGGSSGSGLSAAGSGGGMSQLFLPVVSPNSILVAGGGGGAGGGSGVPGGAAGIEGQPGGNGRNSTGGGGGQATRGGAAGQGGRVLEEASAGERGQGGIGASILLAAQGGGGGGGYFGGGGGGAGYDGCCHPGSGGGGGSSFADSSHLSDVEITTAPSGAGYAVIRFQLLPSYVSHTWQQLNAVSGELRITFSVPIHAVRLERIAVPSCGDVSATPIGSTPAATWKFKLDSCVGETLRFVLGATSLESQSSSGALILGPESEHKLDLGFSSVGAKLRFQSPSLFKSSTATLLLVSDRQVSGLDSSDFRFSGCGSVGVKSTAAGYEVVLANCVDGQHTLRLSAASLRDSFGNPAPSSELLHLFRVDLLAPQATLKLLDLDKSAGTAEIEFRLSEPVSSPLTQLKNQLSAANCEAAWIEASALRFLGTIQCDSPVTLGVSANSLADSANRMGPAAAVELRLEFSGNRATLENSEAAIPPWIPVGASPSTAPQPPVEVAGPASPAPANLNQAGWFESNQTLLRNFALAVMLLLSLTLLIGALRAARSRNERGAKHSAKNDGAVAVNKYPVFGKPANRLGQGA